MLQPIFLTNGSYRKKLLTFPRGLWTLITLIVLMHSPLVQANTPKLTAQVDRTTVEMGDIVHLTLEANFQSRQSPDFERLKDQFDILDVQQSHQFIFANGRLQSLTQWQISLSPKLPGVAMIPPFKVAKAQSQPIKIRVQPASPFNTKQTQQIAWLKSQLSTQTPYVQQGITYRLKLFYQGQLLDGNLRAPELKNALKKLLINQKEYTTYRQGRRYTVIEWVYLFHPLQSGSQTLTSATLNSRLITPTGRLRPLKLHTPAQTLQIKPQPSQYPPNTPWLPAQQLSLALAKPLPAQAKVGDTLNLTITLTAQGLRSAQLPTLAFPSSSDYKVYLDHQESHEEVQGETLISTRHFHYLLIPLKAGKLALPTLQLPWWSLPQNHLAIAKLHLPTLTLSGQMPPQTPAAQPNPTQKSTQSAQTQQSVPSVKPSASQTDLTINNAFLDKPTFWLLLSALLTLLMAFGLFIYWQRIARVRTSSYTNTSHNDLATDPLKSADNLTTLCQQWQSQETTALPERAALIALYQHLKTQPDLAQTPEWQALKQHLFGRPQPKETLRPHLKTLCSHMANPLSPSASKKNRRSDRNTHLNPLYPK